MLMDELLHEFLAEGRELVQQAGEALLLLDPATAAGSDRPLPDDAQAAAIDRAFRAVHTLKGSTGLFDLEPMGALLHVAEDVLGRLRADRGMLAPAMLDALLGCLGASEDWLDTFERTGALPPDAAEQAVALKQRLRAQAAGPDAPAAHAEDDPPGKASDRVPDWLAPLLDRFGQAVAGAQHDGRTVRALRYQPAADCFFLGDDPMALLAQVPELLGLHLEPCEPWDPDVFDPFRCVLVATLLSTAPPEMLRATFRTVPDQVETVVVASAAEEPPKTVQRTDDARLVRVEAGRVDAVVDLAGEMLVARNGLAALLGRAHALDPSFGRALAATQGEIDRLARDLRMAATALRMVPLDTLFRRLPRLAREIAAGLGRPVDLDLSGGAVELDRTIADRLFEPLLHVLRNAIGHGIENAAARRDAGKPLRGRIRIDAVQNSEQVVLSVWDDGAGIDAGRVRAAARARGLLDESRLATLDAAGCLELLFLPGFSTATTVTALSGRGVGMDAVRGAVEAADGRVTLHSRPGEGTTVRIVLPRAVSVTTVLLLDAGGERFGVPIDAVREVVRVPNERIVTMSGGAVFTLRDRVVPLLPLLSLLDPAHVASAADTRTAAIVAVAEPNGSPIGLVVDAVAGRADLLVRRLDGVLADLGGMAGTALGPDGRVLAVLDLAQLVARLETGADTDGGTGMETSTSTDTDMGTGDAP